MKIKDFIYDMSTQQLHVSSKSQYSIERRYNNKAIEILDVFIQMVRTQHSLVFPKRLYEIPRSLKKIEVIDEPSELEVFKNTNVLGLTIRILLLPIMPIALGIKMAYFLLSPKGRALYKAYIASKEVQDFTPPQMGKDTPKAVSKEFSASLKGIPDDMKREVLKHLNVEDVLNLSKVDKSWNQVVTSFDLIYSSLPECLKVGLSERKLKDIFEKPPIAVVRKSSEEEGATFYSIDFSDYVVPSKEVLGESEIRWGWSKENCLFVFIPTETKNFDNKDFKNIKDTEHRKNHITLIAKPGLKEWYAILPEEQYLAIYDQFNSDEYEIMKYLASSDPLLSLKDDPELSEFQKSFLVDAKWSHYMTRLLSGEKVGQLMLGDTHVIEKEVTDDHYITIPNK